MSSRNPTSQDSSREEEKGEGNAAPCSSPASRERLSSGTTLTPVGDASRSEPVTRRVKRPVSVSIHRLGSPMLPTVTEVPEVSGEQNVRQPLEKMPEVNNGDSSVTNDGSAGSPIVITRILQRPPEERQSRDEREEGPTHQTDVEAILQHRYHGSNRTDDTTVNHPNKVPDAPLVEAAHLLPVGGIDDNDAWLEEVASLSPTPGGRVGGEAQYEDAAHT